MFLDPLGNPVCRLGACEARDFLAGFAELESSPDLLHTYRITPVSVWNAAALGITAERIEEILAVSGGRPPAPGGARGYSPAASRNASARSVRSQVNWSSSRPKWPPPASRR